LYKKNSDIIHKCILFNQKPQKVVNYFLSNADVIFCTEDSGSMITESILSKKKVYTIRPKKVRLNKAYKIFIQNKTY
ncbi:MAG: mitochondrial fission ELM1 family protein, partial [Candidatus Hydrothermae bacterium]|nr:mitochondrial fission ELM1 family protein [Candidatus Hydrothermae bacterium]